MCPKIQFSPNIKKKLFAIKARVIANLLVLIELLPEDISATDVLGLVVDNFTVVSCTEAWACDSLHMRCMKTDCLVRSSQDRTH